MTRDEIRAARLSVIAAERAKNPRGYIKHAARLLGMTPKQVKNLAWHWGLMCRQ
jgi:hypothetical protein